MCRSSVVILMPLVVAAVAFSECRSRDDDVETRMPPESSTFEATVRSTLAPTTIAATFETGGQPTTVDEGARERSCQ
jgi:hypothetical protein